MTARIVVNNKRMCDGHPHHECQSGCAVDCDFNTRERAREMAAREFYEPDVPLRVRMFDKPSRINRTLDWLGNLPHRFGRWVDRTPLAQMAGFAIGAVTACALAALTLFHK